MSETDNAGMPDPDVKTVAGRQRTRQCLDGATRDNWFYKLLVEATKMLDAADTTIDRLGKERWYLHPSKDTPTSHYKGQGLTWKGRAEELEAKLKAKDEAIGLALSQMDTPQPGFPRVVIDNARNILEQALKGTGDGKG